MAHDDMQTRYERDVEARIEREREADRERLRRERARVEAENEERRMPDIEFKGRKAEDYTDPEDEGFKEKAEEYRRWLVGGAR